MRARRVLSLGSWIVLLSALSLEAAARRPVIVVGEVSARVAGVGAETERSLRALVTREVERLEVETRGGQGYVLSASLVRLDARSSGAGTEATCVVATTLRRAGSGALLAMMHGRGSAEGEPSAVEGAKERALEAAVHGAVRRVPEAL